MALVPRRLLDDGRGGAGARRVLLRDEEACGVWYTPDPYTVEGAREYLAEFYKDNSESELHHNALVHHHRRRRPPVRGPMALQNCCAAVQKAPAPDVAHARRLAKAETMDVRLRHNDPMGHGLRLDERLSVVGFKGGISSPALASGVPLHAVLVKVNRQPVRSKADVDRELARWPAGTSVFTFSQPTDEPLSDTVLVTKPGATLYRALRDCTVRSGKDSQNPKIGWYKKGELVEAVQEDVNGEGLAVLRTRTRCISSKDDRRVGVQPRGGWVKIRSSKGRKNFEKVRQVTESHEGGLGSLNHRWAGLAPIDRAAETVARYERREGADWATKLWADFYARGEDPIMHWDRREAAVRIQAHVRGYKARKRWAEHGHSRPLGHAGRSVDRSLRLEPEPTAVGMPEYRPRFRSRSPVSRLGTPVIGEHYSASDYTRQKVFQAVMRDDVDAVAQMIDDKVDVIGPNALHDDQGRTALQLAKMLGPQSRVLHLLEDEEMATSRSHPRRSSRSRSRSRSRSPRQQHPTVTRVLSVDPEPSLELRTTDARAVRPRREFREHNRVTARHRSRDRSSSPSSRQTRSPSPRRSRSPSPVPASSVPWQPPPGLDIDDSSSSDEMPATRDGGRRLRRRQQQLQHEAALPMTPGERVAAQREAARSRTSPVPSSDTLNDNTRRGTRRAARSPRQHHHRRQPASRSPSPQAQSPRSIVLTRPRHPSPTTAQDRQRDAEAERVPVWRPPSPKRTLVHRGGGAPDLDADDQTSLLLRRTDVEKHTRPDRSSNHGRNPSRERSRSRSPSRGRSRSRERSRRQSSGRTLSLGRSRSRSRSHSRSRSRGKSRSQSRSPKHSTSRRSRSIDGASIAQLASYRKPPQTVLNTLRAALIALGHPLTFQVQSWSECRRKLTDNEGFADTLNVADDWDAENSAGPALWSQRRIVVVRALLAASEDVDKGGSPRGTSNVTSALWNWTDRQLRYQEEQPQAAAHLSGSTMTMTSGRRSRSRSPSARDGALRVPDVDDEHHRRSNSGSIREIFSSGRQQRSSPSTRRERDIMIHGGELRVCVQQLSLVPDHLQNESRHPFVALSLARGGDQAEQTTKTVHRRDEATFDQEFTFNLPPARVARSHGTYDLRAGDGLLRVSVKDARGYTPLRKPTLIGSDDLDLYALFGPLGRWTALQSPDGRMTGRRLHYTCMLRQAPPGEELDPSDSGIGNSISNLAGKLRALSPNPRQRSPNPRQRPQSLGETQVRRDYDNDREVGEVRLRLEFTPSADEQSSDDWETQRYAGSDDDII